MSLQVRLQIEHNETNFTAFVKEIKKSWECGISTTNKKLPGIAIVLTILVNPHQSVKCYISANPYEPS